MMLEKVLPQIAMNDFTAALNSNAVISQNFINRGRDLIALAERENMNECLSEEMSDYISQCKSQVKMMHEKRRPYTDRLIEMQKLFVSLENKIDPTKLESPASKCLEFQKAYRSELLRKEQEERKRIERNYQQAQRRLMKRKDLSDKQKEEALLRSRKRYDDSERMIDLTAVETETETKILAVEGYLEIIKFWWEGQGKYLSFEELEKILHPMIMFVKKQNRKGVRIKSEFISSIVR